MLTLAISSLSGGQGKTTSALFLGRLLAREGYSVLMVDADPQHNLTTYLGLTVSATMPTLLELLKKTVAPIDAIYPITGNDNLFLIPADNQLDGVQDYLSSSGVSATLLKHRVEEIQNAFQICIIDSPPQRSHISLSVLGAADKVLIPVEASVKGYGSLVRTIDLLNGMTEVKATKAEILGVLPFRDRWFGHNQGLESRLAISEMCDLVSDSLVLPTIKESEVFKKAINGRTLIGCDKYAPLEYPFEVLIETKIKTQNHDR